MATGKEGTDIAMEELTVAHEGFQVDPASPAVVDGADFLVRQRNVGSQKADADGDVDGADFLAWQRNVGAETPPAGLTLSGDVDPSTAVAGDADGDADVDGRDFLVWQRSTGGTAGLPLSGDVDPKTAVPGDFNGDGDVDGRDFLRWQRDSKVSGPEVGDSVAFEQHGGPAGLPEYSELKAGASEVLMESVTIVLPRDAASGQAHLDDDGPSTLLSLDSTGDGAVHLSVEAPDIEFDDDLDLDADF